MDQALLKAKSLAKKGKIQEAQKLYKDVLQAFPRNTRAQQGLAALNKSNQPNVTQSPPQETINELIDLYNQGQLAAVVEQAQALTRQYPNAPVIWNFLGATAAKTGEIDLAINAFKRVIAIKPDYAEAYYNMGTVLKSLGKPEEALSAYKKALETINEIKYLYNNIPDNLNRRKKQKIYNLIDNICLKITGFDNKENMEYFLTRFSNSLTCKLYDLKFFIANKCK